jgi:hypothetical protein
MATKVTMAYGLRLVVWCCVVCVFMAACVTSSPSRRSAVLPSASQSVVDTDSIGTESIPIVKQLIYCLLEPNRYTWVFVVTLLVSFVSAMAIGLRLFLACALF